MDANAEGTLRIESVGCPHSAVPRSHGWVRALNLAEMGMCEVMDRLDLVAPTRELRDADQELAMSGGSPVGSPSVTTARSQREQRDKDWWVVGCIQQARGEEPRKMTKQHSLQLWSGRP